MKWSRSLLSSKFVPSTTVNMPFKAHQIMKTKINISTPKTNLLIYNRPNCLRRRVLTKKENCWVMKMNECTILWYSTLLKITNIEALPWRCIFMCWYRFDWELSCLKWFHYAPILWGNVWVYVVCYGNFILISLACDFIELYWQILLVFPWHWSDTVFFVSSFSSFESIPDEYSKEMRWLLNPGYSTLFSY